MAVRRGAIAAVALVVAAIVAWWLLASSPASGTIAWRHALDGGALEIFVEGGRLYVVTEANEVRELDPATGAPLRAFPAGGRPIALCGDVMVVAGRAGGVQGVSLSSGRGTWALSSEMELPLLPMDAPLERRRRWYDIVQDAEKPSDHLLRAIDLATGRVAWQRPIGTTPLSLLCADDAGVLGLAQRPRQSREVACFAAADGAQRWTAPAGSEAFTTAHATRRGFLLAGAGGLRLLAAEDGRERWRIDLGADAEPPRVLVLEADVLAAGGGTVARIELESGRIVWAAAGPDDVVSWDGCGDEVVVGGTMAPSRVGGLAAAGSAVAPAELGRRLAAAAPRRPDATTVAYGLEPSTGRAAWTLAGRGSRVVALDGEILVVGGDIVRGVRGGRAAWEVAGGSASRFTPAGGCIVFARKGPGEAEVVAVRR